MSTELQVFNNPEFGNLDILWEDGKPLFRATQAATILGYQQPEQAIRKHCKGVRKRNTPSNGGIQSANFITEGDLYRLITHSKLPSAQKFESWVFDDVLPSIRKHGLYATDELINNPDLLIEIATQLKTERQLRKDAEATIELQKETIDVQSQQIAELQPKASYYDVILNCKDAVAVTVIASDYGKSAKWLNKTLEDLDVQYKLNGQKCWILKAKYKDQGYTQTKTHSYLGSDGDVHSKQFTYWTQKGRLFIYDLLRSVGIKPMIEKAF